MAQVEPNYELRFLNAGGTRSISILAVDDDDALKLADLSHNGVDIEVWQDERLVGRISRDGPHPIMSERSSRKG